MMSATFAVSSVYFDTTLYGGEKSTREVNKVIDDMVRFQILSGRDMNSRAFLIIRYCFAAVCFHFDFLSKKLHAKDRLRSSPFFTCTPKEIREIAVTRYPWNKTSETPVITGLPPPCCLIVPVAGDEKRYERHERSTFKRNKRRA